jgi:hypothetical protein
MGRLVMGTEAVAARAERHGKAVSAKIRAEQTRHAKEILRLIRERDGEDADLLAGARETFKELAQVAADNGGSLLVRNQIYIEESETVA